MPFFAVYNLPDNTAQASEITSIFGDNILICTDDGFRWVSLNDLRKGKEPSKHNSKYKCALCYVANNGTKHLGASDTATSVAPAYTAIYKFPPESALISREILKQTASPRAPPYSFVA